jgi:LysR family tdc operon transcriptional activator
MKNMVSEINSLSFSTVMDVSFGYPSLIGLPSCLK